MTSTLVQLFRHNLWANLRLLDACRHLSDEQWDARPADGVYGTVRATLYHVIYNEERYLTALQGRALVDRDGPPQSLPSLDEMREHSQKSGEGLVAVAAELPDGHTLQGTWNGEPYTMPAALLLIQAINHATEHRAQIAAVFTQVGVQPPAMDGWTFEEEGMLK
jgi:uncharacterized damage-inducible protein DinB